MVRRTKPELPADLEQRLPILQPLLRLLQTFHTIAPSRLLPFLSPATPPPEQLASSASGGLTDEDDEKAILATWIGHSTFLLQFDNAVRGCASLTLRRTRLTALTLVHRIS